MKRLLLACACFSLLSPSQAQITLEKKYAPGESVSAVLLEGEGVKYYSSKTDLAANGKSMALHIKLYNTDHSIYKTITSPLIVVGAKSRLYDFVYVANVTTRLFNTTSEVDYSISYSVVDTVGIVVSCNGCAPSPVLRYSSFVKILDEKGATILQLDTCKLDWIGGDEPYAAYGTDGIGKINDKFKLGVLSERVSDGATLVKLDSYWSKKNPVKLIYSLPGQLPDPLALNDVGLLDKRSALLSAPRPNPSDSYTRVEFQLPSEAAFGELTVYNNMGLRMKSYKVDNTFGDLLLNNADLPTGSYSYSLVAGGKRIGSQKMLVIK